MDTFYITTAIDYVNDTIHIGHAFQKVAADVLARYYRIKLEKANVFFLTGTDEYGKKAENAAKKQGLKTQDLVKQISDSDQKQQDALVISYDRFIRTTDPDHTATVQEIWNRAKKSGDIYLGDYEGLYCEGCESYYSEADLVDGKCPLHPTLEIKKLKEKNYFFKWSRYRKFLIDHIKNHPEFIVPNFRANEMLEFAKKIEDIPISRTDFTWGVPVPGDPKQVVYVWFDALTNYLTGVGFLKDEKLFEKFWPANIHILGKDNLRWHALLWPAMLQSANLSIPKTILVNGFLNINGQKISKSIGNVIRPTDWVQRFGVDAVRYYLLRYTVLFEDGDISEEKLIHAYNGDLANGLGNLVARLAKLSEKNGLKLPEDQEIRYIPPASDLEGFQEHLELYQLNLALDDIWRKIKEIDTMLNTEEPWKKEKDQAIEILKTSIRNLRTVAYALLPFMPETSESILKQFSGKIISQKPLFPRVERKIGN